MSTPDATEAKINSAAEITGWGEVVAKNIFGIIGRLVGPDRLPRFIDQDMERRDFRWNPETQKYEPIFPL